MKIAVSSSGNNLDSQIDPRFGRCAYFVVVDTESMSFETFDNESIALGGGAGIQAAQFVASKGAKAILTGNVGPNAVKTLAAAGVEVFVGQNGTVGEAVERYKRGDLQPSSQANVADHHGMAGGSGVTGGGSRYGWRRSWYGRWWSRHGRLWSWYGRRTPRDGVSIRSLVQG